MPSVKAKENSCDLPTLGAAHPALLALVGLPHMPIRGNVSVGTAVKPYQWKKR